MLSIPVCKEQFPETPPFQSKSSVTGESKVGMRMLKESKSKKQILCFWQE
jgi:hypothetical protein